MDVKRPLPTRSNDLDTHEFIHESVVQHGSCPSEVKALVDLYPELVCPLGDFETASRHLWPYNEDNDRVREYLHSVKTRTVSNWLEKVMKISKPPDVTDTAVVVEQ